MLAAACWLVLQQIDGLLHQLQAENQMAAGMESLAAGWPDGELFDRTRALLELWKTGANEDFAERCSIAYTIVDAVVIVLYSLFLLALFARLRPAAGEPSGRLGRIARRPAWWIAGLVAADALETGLRLMMVLRDGAPSGFVLWSSWGATSAKWGLALLMVAAGVSLVREQRKELWPRARVFIYSLWRLRVLTLLSVAFGALLIVDPTDQAPDLLRRWLDGDYASVQGVISAAAAITFGFGIWTAARRIALADYRPHQQAPPQRRILAAALVFALIATLSGFTRLYGTALVLACVWAAVLVRLDKFDESDRRRDARARREKDAVLPDRQEGPELRRAARALAVWPPTAFFLAVASAYAAPPIVLPVTQPDQSHLAIWSVVLVLVSAALAAASAAGGSAILRRLDQTRPRSRLEVRLAVVFLASGAVLGAAIVRPLDVAPWLGTVSVLAAGFTVVALVVAELQRLAETRAPPEGLQALGFGRTPVIGLLLVTLIVASALDREGDYHDVRLDPDAAPSRDGLDLKTAWEAWSERNCVASARPDRDPVPLVIVAAHGGGLRAAYWTASVLTDLLPQPRRIVGDPGCPARRLDRIFAMSGISGGSLGLVSYKGHAERGQDPGWYREKLGEPDFLATPVTWLMVDGARAFVGWPGPDRARRLEEAWEKHNPMLGRGFFEGPRLPLLLLGGTKVESGCRFNVSLLRLSASPETKLQGECAALTRRGGTVGPTRAPAAPLTSEVLDYLCRDRARLLRSTAALLSARFPYVSPSGRLPECSNGPPTTAVVDGGYAEGTGARSALDLWRQLEPLVADHNRRRRVVPIVPVFVQLDNHYAKIAAPGVTGRTAELAVPPVTKGRADDNDDRGTEQEARAAFLSDLPGAPSTRCLLPGGYGRYVRIAPVVSPGLPAPLAWTLSHMSTSDLDKQRGDALAKGERQALLEVLAGRASIDCSR